MTDTHAQTRRRVTPIGGSRQWPLHEWWQRLCRSLVKLFNRITGTSFRIVSFHGRWTVLLAMPVDRSTHVHVGSPHARWVLKGFANLPSHRPRVYVDLAANDPFDRSATFELDKAGWHGLCIEPNPKYTEVLRVVRNCSVVAAAVDSSERLVTFKFKDDLGGIQDPHFDNQMQRARPSHTAQMRTQQLHTVLNAASLPPRIDYLSLDVEGAESAALSPSFAWQYAPQLKEFCTRTPPAKWLAQIPSACSTDAHACHSSSSVRSKYTFLTLTVERPPPDLNARLFEHGYLFASTIDVADVAYVHRSHPMAHRIAQNNSYVQVPAKCSTHKGFNTWAPTRTDLQRLLPGRVPLANLTSCASVFGCCSFPGFPPSQVTYM